MVEIINESSPNAQVVEIDMPMGEVPPAVEELHSEDESLVEEISNGIPPQESDALDEKRKLLLEGPLSHKPSTRFRQMLARPGIIVSYVFRAVLSLSQLDSRPPLGSAMGSVHVAHWKLASIVSTKGDLFFISRINEKF